MDTRRHIRVIEVITVIIIAVVATLAVFARAPEELRVMSADGRVMLDGVAPRSLGSFQIVPRPGTRAPTAPRVGLIYDPNPVSARLPQPLHLSVGYALADLGGRDPHDLGLAAWNATLDRFEFVSSTLDLSAHALVANVSVLTPWTIFFREQPVIPSSVSDRIAYALAHHPPDMVGYTIDVEYAHAPNTFILLAPSYRQGGCNGFFRGDRQEVARDEVTDGGIIYRITVMWERGGDTSRCIIVD